MHACFKKYFLLVIVVLCVPFTTIAQLNAGFTPDKTGGCAPITVFFTNTSNSSSNAVYKWDFGNGNTSTLKNPGAVFRDAGTYKVALTISDSNKTSSISRTITVFKKPFVDFDLSVQKGCVPLSTAFTYNGDTANKTISNYFWDFGDGITESTGNKKVTHAYMNPTQAAVSLTVTDDHGCQSTLLKKDVIKVLPELISSFTSDKKVLCKITDPALFINNSTGPGSLSYQWDFGDGASSSLAQPSHVFATRGTYNISLTVTSSEGCTVTATKENGLNAADFKSEFLIRDPVCDLNTAQFDNKSIPAADMTTWEFSDGYIYHTTGKDSVVRSFPTATTYSVKITNSFGTCSEVITKPIQVRKSPLLNGFISDITTPCGSPATVNFKDTTATAVKWLWSSTGYAYMETTEKNTSYTFNYDDTYNVTLKVTDTAGCTSTVTKGVSIFKPRVVVSSPEDYYGNGVTSCGPKTVHFVVNSSDSIKVYAWDLGDGTTSDVAAPAHLYAKEGNYYVHLSYTTVSGCSGKADLYYPVAIRDSVKADFTGPQTTICGNTTVTFNNLTPIVEYYSYTWNFGDGTEGVTYDRYNPLSIDHKYNDSGYFTVTLIATNLICSDTVVKKNYIKILPPFPKITGYTNTCEGTRGEVTITNGSTQAVSGTWNFGDGTTAPYLNQPEIKHTYNKTGLYKVVLTTTNASCTMEDSMMVPVLLKQHPVISADKTNICIFDDHVTLTYTNLEENPNPDGPFAYSFESWSHSDGSPASSVSGNYLSRYPFKATLYGDFKPGEGLISVINSINFGCKDTTNLIALSIKGPDVGFKQIETICGGSTTIEMEDTSKSRFGVKLVSWEWNFADGQSQTYTNGGNITYDYKYPGTYLTWLKVTDAEGCYDYSYRYANAGTNFLKASFTPSVTTVSPGSSVIFTNTSQTSDITNTTYKWLFGDGTQAITPDAVKVFSTPGVYLVKLIAYHTLKGCTDTASSTITVKKVNAAFAFNSSFISNSKCPPVMVSFTNTSLNVSKITWDFGDGTGAFNVFNPAHVYTKAGRYIVEVTTYSDNGTLYTTKDSVIIDQPSLNIDADISHTCTGQSIRFSAIAEHAASYMWDFGDGTVYPTADSLALHSYSAAGMYMPDVIVTDGNGCSISGNKSDTVVIDSLNVSLQNIPDKICAPKEIVFTPDIVSISGDQASQLLTYHWNFGTGNLPDTSAQRTASFLYEQSGNYTVNFRVQSPYGCIKQVTKNIIASQGLAPFISGPSEICENTSATFTGNTRLPGQPYWKWIFDDGTIVEQQNPPAKKYNKAGNFPVKLVVDNNGCSDTVSRLLLVHSKPAITLSSNNEIICEGSSISITAGGGSSYAWSPAAGLNTTKEATITVSPSANISYVVLVTDAFGCTNSDSVKVGVIHPFTLQVPSEITLCSGKNTRLKVSGGNTYQWINNTHGLDNLTIADPVAAPLSTTIYTVVATGERQCFSDTAAIRVIVNPSPVVQLGNDTTLCQGQTRSLNAFNNNAVYSWQDGSTSPVLVVKKGGEYYVKVDVNNCIASDTIVINQTAIPYFTLGKDTSICTGEQYVLNPSLNTTASFLWQDGSTAPSFVVSKEGIYSLTASNECGSHADSIVMSSGFCNILMPTGFTPNNDGLNDVFRVKYPFAVKAFRMLVYNQWGEKVFETTNMRNGWDGYWKGQPSLQGAYVWVISFTDTNNKLQQLKGTATLIR